MEEVLLSSLVGAVVGTISQIFREWWIQNKAEDKARDFAIFCLVNELKQFRYGCFAFLDSHNGAVISNKYDSFESENTTWGEIQEPLSVPSLSLNISHVNLINMTLVAEYHALSRECEYIKHRFDVITRRTAFDLDKAEKRAHILKGYQIALENIDRIIELIRASSDGTVAREQLIEKYAFTDIQARSILDMKLQRLTGLEREKIDIEFQEIEKLIKEFSKRISGSIDIL